MANTNTMPFKFEKLEIWKLALNFADDIHNLTRTFPKDETFSLTSQFKRAVDSISLNISEGSIGQSNPEQIKFLGYAIRSIAECVNCLYLARKRNYITIKSLQLPIKKLKKYLPKQINSEMA
jgi:four helix bundle protein